LDWVEDVEDAAMANPELAARIAEQSPEQLVLEQLFNDRMKEALATLPQRWQQVIVLVYIENRPYPEIADQLNLSVAATRQLARRARIGMRNALAARSGDEWAVA
jgi:RNA polymerase sigma factor (sigma-70 family)